MTISPSVEAAGRHQIGLEGEQGQERMGASETVPLLARIYPPKRDYHRHSSDPIADKKARDSNKSSSSSQGTSGDGDCINDGSTAATFTGREGGRRHSVQPTFHYGEFETLMSTSRASFGGCMVDMGEMAMFRRDSESVKEGPDVEASPQIVPKRKEEEELEATYWNLFRTNRPYLLYILSYFAAHIGEWFTYVAAITAIQEIVPDSQTAVSALVVLRMIPNVFFASVGGVLADALDRRMVMIVLDTVGIFVVLLYIPMLHFHSLFGIYLVAFMQATVAALYDPVRQAIVPLMVPNEVYLKKAVTISGLSWSLMAAVGSSLGGLAASAFGIRACFALDSLTYIMSAVLMWAVGGEWSVSDHDFTSDSLSLSKVLETYKTMTVSGAKYLFTSSFAALVLLKTSGAITVGATDVLNARFSHQPDDPSNDSTRLGMLFAATGIGSILGPLVADPFVDMQRPRTMQFACVVSMALIPLGYAGMALFESFSSIFFFTMVRGFGMSTVWVQSSLLLQVFSAPEVLGRVLSVDFGLCTLAISVAAFLAGVLEDTAHFSQEEVSWLFAFIGLIVSVLWFAYHWGMMGAAAGSGMTKRDDYEPSRQEEVTED